MLNAVQFLDNLVKVRHAVPVLLAHVPSAKYACMAHAPQQSRHHCPWQFTTQGASQPRLARRLRRATRGLETFSKHAQLVHVGEFALISTCFLCPFGGGAWLPLMPEGAC